MTDRKGAADIRLWNGPEPHAPSHDSPALLWSPLLQDVAVAAVLQQTQVAARALAGAVSSMPYTTAQLTAAPLTAATVGVAKRPSAASLVNVDSHRALRGLSGQSDPSLSSGDAANAIVRSSLSALFNATSSAATSATRIGGTAGDSAAYRIVHYADIVPHLVCIIRC